VRQVAVEPPAARDVAEPRKAAEAARADRRRLAVLPFANLGDDPANAAFVGGVHDTLITQIAKVPGLTVISRSPVLQFAGSVQLDGRRLRIQAQLIDASSDAHLWAETFDRSRRPVRRPVRDRAGRRGATARSPRRRRLRATHSEPDLQSAGLRALRSRAQPHEPAVRRHRPRRGSDFGVRRCGDARFQLRRCPRSAQHRAHLAGLQEPEAAQGCAPARKSVRRASTGDRPDTAGGAPGEGCVPVPGRARLARSRSRVRDGYRQPAE